MYAKLLDNDRVLVRITRDHPRFEELSSRSYSDASPAAARYEMPEGLEVILGPEHPRHASIVRALKYAYDPNEPRDETGKWTHGERANSLHQEHAALKKKRLAVHKEVKAAAIAVRDKIDQHVNNIFDALDQITDTSTLDEVGFGDLEVSDPAADQMDILKEAEKVAKAELAKEPVKLTDAQKQAKQQAQALSKEIDENWKRHTEISDRIMSYRHQINQLEGRAALNATSDEKRRELQAQSNKIFDEWQAYAKSTKPEYDGLFAERDAKMPLLEDLQSQLPDEEIDEVDHAANVPHLNAIIEHARAAQKLLPTFMQHRKEMRAIRHGKPIKVKKPKSIKASSDASPADPASGGQRTLFQRRGHPHRYHCDKKLRAAIKKAASETDTNPTDLQRKVGNYAKGKVRIQGLEIAIENPKGSTRSGVGKDGTPWSVKMKNHYGYIKCAISEADGDHIDVFVGPKPESEIVFVIDQVDGDWNFDEHKCMLGWTNAADAKAGYLANYSENWHGFQNITAMTMDEFKRWIAEGNTARPVA